MSLLFLVSEKPEIIVMGEKNKEKNERANLLISGSIILGVGIIFLLINMDVIPGLHDTWPILIIIVGIALIVGGFASKKKADKELTP